MKLTYNQQIIKRNNKTLVFQIIKDQAPLSRADIAQRLGLNKSTVSSLVNELLEDDLVYETGPGESSGGRRPVLLLFNQHAGYTIGIDIGVNYILGVLTDLQGNIVNEKNVYHTQIEFTSIVSQVKEIISSLLKNAPDSRYGVVGIGIGVPGIVDKEGKVLLAPNLGWEDVFIKKEIEDHFNIPVIIENEANAGAYGEKQFGAGQEYDNILYVSAGIGIGVGLILNGELYQGNSGFSGEAGHMLIDIGGRKCSCGREGCWEAYASEHALLKMAKQLGHIDLSLEGLISLANQENEEVIELFKQVGTYIGYGISNLINSFNPKQVIIGNRMSVAKHWLKAPIEEAITQHALSYHRENLEVTFSKRSIYSAALGVSAFAVEQFFNEEQLLEQV